MFGGLRVETGTGICKNVLRSGRLAEQIVIASGALFGPFREGPEIACGATSNSESAFGRFRRCIWGFHYLTVRGIATLETHARERWRGVRIAVLAPLRAAMSAFLRCGAHTRDRCARSILEQFPCIGLPNAAKAQNISPILTGLSSIWPSRDDPSLFVLFLNFGVRTFRRRRPAKFGRIWPNWVIIGPYPDSVGLAGPTRANYLKHAPGSSVREHMGVIFECVLRQSGGALCKWPEYLGGSV